MPKVILILLSILLLSSCKKDKNEKLQKPKEINISISNTHTLQAKSFSGNNSSYLLVMEAGLGNGLSIWEEQKFINKIAKNQDVIIYSRAGYEKSSMGSNPRNVNRLRQELEAVIAQTANGRKVILVGHSYGGLIIRDFAIKNPTKIAALLFVDSSHELYNFPLSQEKEDFLYTELLKAFGANHGATREARELNESLAYISIVGNLPDIPIVALTSMKADESNLAADQFNGKTRQDWFNAHKSLQAGVSDFTQIATQNAGHYIMLEEPQLVIDQINILKSKLP